MGYFSFYIIKQAFYSIIRYIKKNKRFIISFIIFVAFMFIKQKCFGFDYDSQHYVEWKNDTYNYNKTIRVCAGVDFALIPNKSNNQALNAIDLATGNITPVSIYADGVDMYGHELSGSWFLTGNNICDGAKPINTYKGYYMAFTNYNNTVIEYSSNFSPFIYNDNVSTWDFTNLIIPLGSGIIVNPNYMNRWKFTLYVNHNGTTYSYNLNNNENLEYITFYGNSSYRYDFNYSNVIVPKYNLLKDVVLKKNDVITFTLKTEFSTDNFVNVITDYYSLGSYNYGVTDNEEINNNLGAINQNIDNINNSIQQTTQAVEDNTQAVEHLEQTITDSNVQDNSIQLPTIDVYNPTQSGIEHIFNNFYNAFCSGEAQDIIIPIPNTNKSFTLSSNYLRDNLSANNGEFIINFVTAVWWYTIGSWIVKDVWDKIFAIQEGNVENVQKSNIAKEML